MFCSTLNGRDEEIVGGLVIVRMNITYCTVLPTGDGHNIECHHKEHIAFEGISAEFLAERLIYLVFEGCLGEQVRVHTAVLWHPRKVKMATSAIICWLTYISFGRPVMG